MRMQSVIVASLVALLSASGAMAQSSQIPTAGKTAPPVTTTTTVPAAKMGSMTPSQPTTSSMSGMAKSVTGTKVNLNTANATQLDALPGVGKSRASAILTERAKGPFKDWGDFDTRTAHSSVNSGVKSKIKDLVTF